MSRGKTENLRILVAVGSRRDRVCSVGAFARVEAGALRGFFKDVEILEPASSGDAPMKYPGVAGLKRPDVILYHAPSLHDRGRPWRPLASALKLRAAFPGALFIPVVHEFSEAPEHWKIRQRLILRVSHGAIVNSEADFEGLKGAHRRLLRAHLGPTLFFDELLGAKDERKQSETLLKLRARARAEIQGELAHRYGLSEADANRQWVLHPGLVTPGKGVDRLGKLKPLLGEDVRLIVMGGLGPKQSDRQFAEQALDELRRLMQGRLSFVEAPDDELFRRFLLAADLVVLPYDVGLSERRSSFLSAMCCGANVWTTTGPFTPPLALESAGVHHVSIEDWAGDSPAIETSVGQALSESDDERLGRRLKNLAWAAERSWDKRVAKVADFISSLR